MICGLSQDAAGVLRLEFFRGCIEYIVLLRLFAGLPAGCSSDGSGNFAECFCLQGKRANEGVRKSLKKNFFIKNAEMFVWFDFLVYLCKTLKKKENIINCSKKEHIRRIG